MSFSRHILVLTIGIILAADVTPAVAQRSWTDHRAPFFFSAPEIHTVGAAPRTMTVADIDNNGKLDVLVANAGAAHISILFDGAPVIHNVPVEAGTMAIAAADIDRDGDLDLVTTSRSSSVLLLHNAGDGTFGTPLRWPMPARPVGVAVADFDSDGDVDLAVTTEGWADDLGGVWLLKNSGDSAFESPMMVWRASFPTFLVSADFDRDGDVDLAVPGLGTHILLNGDNGTFTGTTFEVDPDFTIPYISTRATVIDFDDDGDSDVLVASYAFVGGDFLFRNDGSGSFTSQRLNSHQPVFSEIMVDLDEDGALDRAAATAIVDGALVWRNNADGTFAFPYQRIETGSNRSVDIVAIDRDDDGHQDLAVIDNIDATMPIVRTVPGVASLVINANLEAWTLQLNHDDLTLSSAHDIANYRVTAAGSDGNANGNFFDDGDEPVIGITKIEYDTTVNRVVLSSASPLFGDLYRFEIDGDDATNDGTEGLIDPDGNRIAGGDRVVTLDLRATTLVQLVLQCLEREAALDATSLLAQLRAAHRILEGKAHDTAGPTQLLTAFVRDLDRMLSGGVLTAQQHQEFKTAAEIIIRGLNLASPHVWLYPYWHNSKIIV